MALVVTFKKPKEIPTHPPPSQIIHLKTFVTHVQKNFNERKKSLI